MRVRRRHAFAADACRRGWAPSLGWPVARWNGPSLAGTPVRRVASGHRFGRPPGFNAPGRTRSSAQPGHAFAVDRKPIVNRTPVGFYRRVTPIEVLLTINLGGSGPAPGATNVCVPNLDRDVA